MGYENELRGSGSAGKRGCSLPLPSEKAQPSLVLFCFFSKRELRKSFLPEPPVAYDTVAKEGSWCLCLGTFMRRALCLFLGPPCLSSSKRSGLPGVLLCAWCRAVSVSRVHFTFRGSPVWMVNYMVSLPRCQTIPRFLKLASGWLWGQRIHSRRWGACPVHHRMFSSNLASTRQMPAAPSSPR